MRFAYDPHLPPVLRWDPTGAADKLPELLKTARARPLTADETQLLNDALRHQEPWLEWAGKREKKRFQVEPVALHIHERISAQAILKVAARQDVQRSLFADPELEYREAVQFYQHDVDWANRMILGDSLQVMASLAYREDLAGKVQMIYMDPPYGIKFASNFQPEIGKRDVKDKEADLTREPEMVKAYRDTWTLGVHSYLAYLRDRLILCRELLADTGSIFVQISDENIHRVRCVLDEVFGAKNLVAEIVFATSTGRTARYLDCVADRLLWYAKSVEGVKFKQLFTEKSESAEFPYEDENGRFALADLSSQHESDKRSVPYVFRGKTYNPPAGRQWAVDPEEGLTRLNETDRIYQYSSKQIRFKKYATDYPVTKLNNVWTDTQFGAFQSQKIYVVQTNTKVITRCLLMTTDTGDLVLDPTCGSGTTAYVAEQWGRRWITIDTSRVALALARQRLLTATYAYYKLKGPGVGVSPMNQHQRGQDARATIHIRQGAYLPHWTQEGATHAVTFRLGDSLPQHVLENWRLEREHIIKTAAQMKRPLSEREEKRLHQLYSEKVEKYLDAGYGACWLKRDDIAEVVANALQHFDGARYELFAWCVMPNHVHVVVKPLPGHELPQILHSWKSFTAKEANKRLNRTGQFWQPEPYDHLIRDEADFIHAVNYVLRNPEMAGLHNWKWVGCKSGTGVPPVGLQRPEPPVIQQEHGQDARATSPAVGFVYKTVPHITLKSIAQNVALDAILDRHQPILDQKLSALNAALKTVTPELRQRLRTKLLEKEKREGKRSVTDADQRRWLLPEVSDETPDPLSGWREWEVPFDADEEWPPELKAALEEYRAAWRAKMDEVNACIAANAEREVLVDQPEAEPGVVRVSGPFTMEAVMPVEESLESESPIGGEPEELETFGEMGEDRELAATADEPVNAEAYLDKMLRLLRADGVRFPNNKVLEFTRLEPCGGEYLHAEGEWETENGQTRAVAVSFGPQFGPVTAYQVENALPLASRRGFDDLVFAGFSFDATAQAIIQDDPNLRVRCHLAHIRPDVNMGDLLKETPSSQIFTVFGSPRTELRETEDGLFVIEMQGVDIYNPVDNTILPTNADKVAAWFVDTDYDGRTFCITQAFFPDKKAWKKLARALKGVIDEERFEALSGTVSLPFPAGKHQRAAVKVIDPRGNEVMRVHRLGAVQYEETA